MNIPELPDDVRIFNPTYQSLHEVWDKVSQFDNLFAEGEKDREKFFARLLADTTVVLQLKDGNGIMYLYEMVPGHVADIHAVFFDKKLSARKPVLMDCLTWAFLTFDLVRIEAFIPEIMQSLRRLMERKLHFVEEGRMRKRTKYAGRFQDLIIYSILREEHEKWVKTEQHKLDLRVTFGT